ncbi:hypothetical protein ACH0BE_01740 [Bacillus subtilis]|uniref:hypothetical protein n=1 Tax=Bacillus subtilis TaxID=1423 RepID=UPI00387946A5
MKWEETKDTQGVPKFWAVRSATESGVCLPTSFLGHSPFFPFEVRNGKVFHLVSYMKR